MKILIFTENEDTPGIFNVKRKFSLKIFHRCFQISLGLHMDNPGVIAKAILDWLSRAIGGSSSSISSVLQSRTGGESAKL